MSKPIQWSSFALILLILLALFLAYPGGSTQPPGARDLLIAVQTPGVGGEPIATPAQPICTRKCQAFEADITISKPPWEMTPGEINDLYEQVKQALLQLYQAAQAWQAQAQCNPGCEKTGTSFANSKLTIEPIGGGSCGSPGSGFLDIPTTWCSGCYGGCQFHGSDILGEFLNHIRDQVEQFSCPDCNKKVAIEISGYGPADCPAFQCGICIYGLTVHVTCSGSGPSGWNIHLKLVACINCEARRNPQANVDPILSEFQEVQ